MVSPSPSPSSTVSRTVSHTPAVSSSCSSSITMSSSPSPSSSPPFTPPCPSGWTYFADDGVEGHDSCIAVYTTNTANTFDALSLSCALAGGHLLSTMSLVSSTGLVPTSSALLSHSPAIIGCNQTVSAVQRAAGWRWTDGTDGVSINELCTLDAYDGGGGCPLWAPGEPKYVHLSCPLLHST